MIEFLKENFVWLAGIFTAAKWVYEYSQKLRWDKSRFLLERIEDLMERESTQQVHFMLDWNVLDLEIDGRKLRIDDTFLLEALQTHDKKHSFTKDEMKIREIFDEYFDGLTEFLILHECGLINKSDLRKFLKYWLDILSGERSSKPEKLKTQIQSYMIFYGFQRLHGFLTKKDSLFLKYM